ncbi:putative phosphoribosyltransferase [Lupinus albus]|uniref:Putative phosphoribosyltransferase n=1 Tax=Lupinus albus TaxID=3870 RepID=A0A6A4N499_LUPAL|nr:putative phosphoribosyltransferase [Lupinus albus]
MFPLLTPYNFLTGKIRFRLSTLGRGKVHAHSYPLITLQPSWLKKMGEIHLAVRFSWSFLSTLDICKLYIEPLLPKHHYVFPLSPSQSDTLRNQASNLISHRLGSAEPPLRKEFVHYILDMRSNLWSMRKARANVERVMNLIGNIVFLWKLLQDIRYKKKHITFTLAFNIMCMFFFITPQLIFPLVFCYIIHVGVTSYFKRPKKPCYIDAKLCGAETSSGEDFEEELDPCPTQLEGKALRMRYDRLRYIFRSTQKMVDEIATIGEKVQSLSSWRDEIATFLFALFCSVGLLVTIIVPTQVLIFLCITYYLWYPRFRSILPSVPENLFRRMLSKQAFIL